MIERAFKMKKMCLIESLILPLALSLFLFGCNASEPTGTSYHVDEDLLGKKFLLSELIDFSKIENADRVVITYSENSDAGKRATSQTLLAERTALVIQWLKSIPSEAAYSSSVSPTYQEDALQTIHYEFKKEDASLGHVRLFYAIERSILVFDMSMLTEGIRHPSMVFVSEGLHLEENTGSFVTEDLQAAEKPDSGSILP